MVLVAVKDRFQVTVPAQLREGVRVRVCDLMEATVHEDGILLRPKSVVDREAVADRLERLLRKAPRLVTGYAGLDERAIERGVRTLGEVLEPSLLKRTRVAYRVSGSCVEPRTSARGWCAGPQPGRPP